MISDMFRRHIETVARQALADTPVVLIQGPRQVGKSTFVLELARSASRRYITLDDASTLAAATHDPDGFVNGLEGAVVIDEVQRAPELFRAIKGAVDRARVPGRFLLTGSANVLLLPSISESLAGRIEIIPMWPLSQGEIGSTRETFITQAFSNFHPIAQSSGGSILERVVRGGFPEPLSREHEDRRAAWFASYITTILQRDVRDLQNVDRLADMPRLLSLLASRTAGLLNVADVGRSVGLAQTTLKRYLSLFEATFLLVLIPAWSSNLGLRLSKAPKVVLTDTGVCSHLMGMTEERLKSDGHARGILLENFVAMELLKQSSWSVPAVKLFHFRTASGKEVDLVLEDAAGRVVGIEVKSAATVHANDFKGLRALQEAVGDRFFRGLVLFSGSELVHFDSKMSAVPLGALWAAGVIGSDG